MKAELLKHDKITDELGNTVEIKLWKVPISAKQPHGIKYSLVYIVGGERIIGYDNAEGKGNHIHYETEQIPYEFKNLLKLAEDFFRDVKKYKGEGDENKKG